MCHIYFSFIYWVILDYVLHIVSAMLWKLCILLYSSKDYWFLLYQLTCLESYCRFYLLGGSSNLSHLLLRVCFVHMWFRSQADFILRILPSSSLFFGICHWPSSGCCCLDLFMVLHVRKTADFLPEFWASFIVLVLDYHQVKFIKIVSSTCDVTFCQMSVVLQDLPAFVIFQCLQVMGIFYSCYIQEGQVR